MNKQQYLDQETETNEIWVTQQLITALSKTQLQHAQRQMKMVHKAAYKSWAREMPFEEMLTCVAKATKLMTDDTDQLENES